MRHFGRPCNHMFSARASSNAKCTLHCGTKTRHFPEGRGEEAHNHWRRTSKCRGDRWTAKHFSITKEHAQNVKRKGLWTRKEEPLPLALQGVIKFWRKGQYLTIIMQLPNVTTIFPQIGGCKFHHFYGLLETPSPAVECQVTSQ